MSTKKIKFDYAPKIISYNSSIQNLQGTEYVSNL
jgi:hypothetical protein